MDYDILVIDDEKSIRKLFSLILKKANYSVSNAASGPEGLKLLETNTYQLILLDLKMPGMDGTETLREIRKIAPSIPVYIVSAFHSEYFEERKSLIEDGLEFQILRKPIDKEELLFFVDILLRKESPARDLMVKLRFYALSKTKRAKDTINLLHEIFQNEWGGLSSLSYFQA